MGYDLHITRREFWCDESGNSISADEWADYVQSDKELRMDESHGEYFAVWSGPSVHEIPWMDWDEGNITSKNPDDALVIKMVEIATSLNAKVQGDDGEIYGNDGEPQPMEPTPQKPAPDSLYNRAVKWLSSLSSSGSKSKTSKTLPFKIGDRIQDSFGSQNTGTVVAIDLQAEHGLGRITVKYDDGRTLNTAAYAHGLRPLS